jgi:murein L,D-transpeptidase YafK
MTPRRLCFLLLAALALPLCASASSNASPFWWESSPKDSGTKDRRPAATVPPASTRRVDRILVKKSERRLYLMRGNQPFRTYRIALGYQPIGHKRYKGDGRTPEGRYFLDWRSAHSKYYKSMHISYPSLRDLMRARSKGNDPGGMILIHGQPSSRTGLRSGDWTFGCIAVSNLAMDEIWSYTDVGITVEILP